MVESTLENLGKKLATKMSKEVCSKTCEQFFLGYYTTMSISPEEHELLSIPGNGDIVSTAFENAVKLFSWADNLYRITIGFTEDDKEVCVGAYTRRIITGEMLDNLPL